MRYRGIIFDLDGVICSTDQYHYQAWKMLADRLDIPFDQAVNDRLRGVGRLESLEIILEQSGKSFSPQEKERLAEQKNTDYVALLEQMTPKDLSFEVFHTMEELRREGILLAIGSSSRNAERILERLGLGTFFDAVSDGTNIKRSKPDPEVFLRAAGLLKLSPRECLVVEDAKAGIDAACAGGFDSAGLGQAAGYGKTVYPLNCFSGLLKIIQPD